jgi:hypothetical protein
MMVHSRRCHTASFWIWCGNIYSRETECASKCDLDGLTMEAVDRWMMSGKALVKMKNIGIEFLACKTPKSSVAPDKECGCLGWFRLVSDVDFIVSSCLSKKSTEWIVFTMCCEVNYHLFLNMFVKGLIFLKMMIDRVSVATASWTLGTWTWIWSVWWWCNLTWWWSADMYINMYYIFHHPNHFNLGLFNLTRFKNISTLGLHIHIK